MHGQSTPQVWFDYNNVLIYPNIYIEFSCLIPPPIMAIDGWMVSDSEPVQEVQDGPTGQSDSNLFIRRLNYRSPCSNYGSRTYQFLCGRCDTTSLRSKYYKQSTNGRFIYLNIECLHYVNKPTNA